MFWQRLAAMLAQAGAENEMRRHIGLDILSRCCLSPAGPPRRSLLPKVRTENHAVPPSLPYAAGRDP